MKDESTESSTDDSEDFRPLYRGSIPKLIVTSDMENEHDVNLCPFMSDCPVEFKSNPPPRPIPVFTFTCEDFDEQNSCNDQHSMDEQPPPVPDPPVHYEQSSESGEPVCLTPQMKPIDTKLTLDLFNVRSNENDTYRRRCTELDECVSACDCCRTPQPETKSIPFIDEPNSEPVIFENGTVPDKITTPKIRRILPSMSLDNGEDKPETADAVCQTPSSPIKVDPEMPVVIPLKLKIDLDVHSESQKIQDMNCRLKRTLFSVSNSFSNKSEEFSDMLPSTFSTSDSMDDTINENKPDILIQSPAEACAKKILDSVDRKSWKSPDEFRPSFGKVKALTKHFNDINLTYSVKTYKRHCQSSPNLSGRPEKVLKIAEPLPTSASLVDIRFDIDKTETTESGDGKLTDEEVKSIIIQLEDWSRYGSRGSEDTLANGNEFELPNLPSEDQIDCTNGFVFNEFFDRKPKRITLENIKIKSNQSSLNSERDKSSCESLARSESSEKTKGKNFIGSTNISNIKRILQKTKQHAALVRSCPDLNSTPTTRKASPPA